MSSTSFCRYVKLKEIAALVAGGTPYRKAPQCFAEKGIPWAKIENLDQGEIYETSEYLSEEGARRVRVVPAGSVLISVIGTIGKVGIAGVDLAANQQILSAVFRADSGVLPKYVYYYLKYSRPGVENLAYTTVESRISTGRLEQFVLPLPPEQVQSAVVELMETADRYAAAQQEKLAQLRRLCKAAERCVMKELRFYEVRQRAEALEKLTEQIRDQSELLIRSLLHRIFDAWETDKNGRYQRQELYGRESSGEEKADAYLQSLEGILRQLSAFQRRLFLEFYEGSRLDTIPAVFGRMQSKQAFAHYQLQDALGSAKTLQQLGLLRRQEGRILTGTDGKPMLDENGKALGISMFDSVKEGTVPNETGTDNHSGI